jgi:heat shock protein HspQ
VFSSHSPHQILNWQRNFENRVVHYLLEKNLFDSMHRLRPLFERNVPFYHLLCLKRKLEIVDDEFSDCDEEQLVHQLEKVEREIKKPKLDFICDICGKSCRQINNCDNFWGSSADDKLLKVF